MQGYVGSMACGAKSFFKKILPLQDAVAVAAPAPAAFPLSRVLVFICAQAQLGEFGKKNFIPPDFFIHRALSLQVFLCSCFENEVKGQLRVGGAEAAVNSSLNPNGSYVAGISSLCIIQHFKHSCWG